MCIEVDVVILLNFLAQFHKVQPIKAFFSTLRNMVQKQKLLSITALDRSRAMQSTT